MEVSPKYQHRFDKYKVCVLIPTYNNAATLSHVIDNVLKVTTNIIIVNDGSTDETSDILENYHSLLITGYPKNKGKGYALRQGFKTALSHGYEFAISIDSDGQHFPEQLPLFIDKLESSGPALLIGSRNMDQSSVPGKSSFGHKFSNFWFYVETGIKAPDTQSGFRLYPVKLLEQTSYLTNKFEFEIEVLVRAAWKGIKIDSLPVKVYYAPAGERVSHFRPFVDFTRISILNTFLVLIAFLYIHPRNFIRSLFRKQTYQNLKDEMFKKEESTVVLSLSIAFGVFMGIIPIWGFQLIVAIALAVFLKLNKALVIISANISIPPMIPLIIFLSYKMGAFWVDQSTPVLWNSKITLESIHLNFIQYVYGSITLAVVAGALFGITSWIIITVFKKNKITYPNE